MASTPSPSLRLELLANGEQAGLWGTTTNTNLGTLLEQAIVGMTTITMANTNYTLTNSDYVVNEARSAVLVAIGSNAAVRDIIAPLAKKLYIVKNLTAGGFAIRIRASSGAAVSIPNQAAMTVYCDGTDFYAATLATNVIPTGIISLWSGAKAAIPAGWLLCDGTNGTPNLQDRFVVGAGSTYAVDVSGGSTDSIVVSHTHTAASVSSFVGNVLAAHGHGVTDPGHRHGMVPVTSGGSTLQGGPGYTLANGFTQTAVTGISVQTTSAGTPSGTVSTVTTNTAVGSTGVGANLPPYYALCYIMKS